MARDAAATGMQVAAAHGYDYWHLLSMMHFGIGEGLLGRYEEGATLTSKGIAALESTGARANLSYFLGAAAHVELVAGHAERARTTIDSAIRHADTTHERFFQALLYQQRGEIALRLNPSDERAAEADFLAAMQVAKTQRALSLELRAASSLHRIRWPTDETRSLDPCWRKSARRSPKASTRRISKQPGPCSARVRNWRPRPVHVRSNTQVTRPSMNRLSRESGKAE